MCGVYGRDPYLIPESFESSYNKPEPYLKRVEAGHAMDWVRACKESPDAREEASSNFSYSGPLNEMVVMGVIAVRLQDLKKELEWDGQHMRFTNISDSEAVKIIKSDKFTVIDGHPHFDTQYTDPINAKAFAEELIRHNYREGWTI
jgi:hypothetical protein